MYLYLIKSNIIIRISNDTLTLKKRKERQDKLIYKNRIFNIYIQKHIRHITRRKECVLTDKMCTLLHVYKKGYKNDKSLTFL